MLKMAASGATGFIRILRNSDKSLVATSRVHQLGVEWCPRLLSLVHSQRSNLDALLERIPDCAVQPRPLLLACMQVQSLLSRSPFDRFQE